MKNRLMGCMRGFSIIEILIAIGVASILGLGVAALLGQLSKGNQNATLISNLRFELERHLGAVRSTAGWDATITDNVNNPNLDCLRNTPLIPTSDCLADLDPPPPAPPAVPPAPTRFVNTLYSASGGAIIYQRVSANPAMMNGFKSDGSPCHLNDAGVPTAGCPIGLLIWIYHNTCGGAPCLQPPVMIETVLRTFPGPETPRINFNNYRFRVAKNGMTDLDQFCTSLHGTLNPGPPVTCQFNQNSCSAPGNGDDIGSYMVGFDPNWNVLCSSDKCGPKEIVTGTMPNGSPICTDAPTGALGCGANEMMSGISRDPASGNLVPSCTAVTVPQANQCAPGYAPTGIDSQGRVTGCTQYHQGNQDCIAANKVIGFIGAGGAPACVDKADGGNCGPGDIVKGITSTGTPSCGQVIQRNTCSGARQFVKTINADGTVTCGTYPDKILSECESKQEVDMPAAGHFYVTCPAGKIAVGGGGWCGVVNEIQASEPWPVNSATGSNQWHVICNNYSILGNATAVCCKVN